MSDTISKYDQEAINYINNQIGVMTGKELDLGDKRVFFWFVDALVEAGENVFKYYDSRYKPQNLQFRIWKSKMLKSVLIKNKMYCNGADRNKMIARYTKHFEYEIHQLQWELKSFEAKV